MQQLATGRFDAVTLIHNETSTGVMNPLAEICEVVRRYPDVVLIVDTVSSFSAVPIAMDELGIDVLLTGSQKALALPPGFSLFSVSEKGFARAAENKDRGYYFDFLEFRKNQEGRHDADHAEHRAHPRLAIEARRHLHRRPGARYARHARTNALVHDWVRRRGFEFFAEEGYRSVTLTCVQNNRGIDVAKLVRDLREAPPRDRRRLRQDQRADVPPLEHGRRNRRDRRAIARRARRLPRRPPAISGVDEPARTPRPRTPQSPAQALRGSGTA